MKKKGYGKSALFLTAMLWGTTFAIGKIATEVFSASFIIALRFSVASIALIITAIPLYHLLNRQYWIDGMWMGITLFLSYILQVAGLAMDTSPGKSAFLCTTYCVMVPFLYWFVTKKRPKFLHVLCVFICLLGIGILSLQGGLEMSAGDVMTVLSGVPCAVNIVISAIVCQNKNPLLLTTIELGVVSVLAWICVLFTDTFPKEFPINTVGGIVYLGLIATALCLYLQSYGLKYAEPSIGGMLLSLESVFGVIFSIIIYHEKITFRMIVGFVVIFVAILLSQYEPKKKNNV
jgi:drug/metabolite transporter (DMT)-like permease